MLNPLDLLAFKFFKLFAQYESALKEMGYVVKGPTNSSVFVDWERFISEKIGIACKYPNASDMDAAQYILDHPPMVQVLDEQNRPVWREAKKDAANPQTLFKHIRQIRTNLFHGAKFNSTWFDPERSQRLMECGLIILQYHQGSLGRSETFST